MILNGERVRQARELKGMTQSALALGVGVSQSAIAQIESGLCSTAHRTAALIAQHTSQPVSFFLQPAPPEFPEGSLLFRANASVNRRDLTQMHRHAQWAFEIHIRLSSHLRKRSLNFKPLEAADPVSAAQRARRIIGLTPTEPVPHLLNLVEWHGVIVLALPDLQSRDGFSVWLKDSPVIAISAGRTAERTRVSVSHELGHLLMHAGKARFQIKEVEAEDFAAELLLPEAAMRKELRQPVTLSAVVDLKPRWRVSVQTLLRRANTLAIINDRQHRYLSDQYKQFLRNGFDPHSIAAEKPRGLRQMAEMVYGNPIDYQWASSELGVLEECLSDMLHRYEAKDDRKASNGNVVAMPKRRKPNTGK